MKQKIFVGLMLSAWLFSSGAMAQEKTGSSFGVELGALYLSQSSGGDTLTALPILNWNFSHFNDVSLGLQVGGTAYKDADSDNTFWISMLRVNPSYHFSNSKYSISIPVGFQLWDGRGAASDVGLRAVRNIESWTSFLSEAYLGVGYIDQGSGVVSCTIGVSKWF